MFTICLQFSALVFTTQNTQTQAIMASFRICVRGRRGDGLYPVYIRITHNRQVGYIKTDKCVDVKNIRKGEVTDPNVLAYCSQEIIRYNEALNAVDLSSLTVSEIVAFLKKLDDDISFSEYARFYVRRMAIEWKMERNAKNYGLALRSLEIFMDRNNILCPHLSGKVIQDWISELDKHTHRAKEMYPTCVRIMFNAILDEYNDYEKGIIRIKNNPFRKIRIIVIRRKRDGWGDRSYGHSRSQTSHFDRNICRSSLDTDSPYQAKMTNSSRNSRLPRDPC